MRCVVAVCGQEAAGLRLWVNNDNRIVTIDFRLGRSLALPRGCFGSLGAGTSRRDVHCARRCPNDFLIRRTAFYVEPFLCVDCSSVRFAGNREGSVV